MNKAKKETFIDASYFNIKNEKKALEILLQNLHKGEIILDLGAGTQPYKKYFLYNGLKYISIDFEGKQDYIIDLNNDKLPFDNNSIDNICLFQVLEHIFDTKHLFDEINRVLKVNGKIFISTPFIFPLHGIPYDFHRYTEYFYRNISTKYNYKIELISSGIYGLGNILYVINLFIGYYSFFRLYRFLVSPIILLNNLFILINNYLVNFLPKKIKFSLKYNIVSDYVVIFKKL